MTDWNWVVIGITILGYFLGIVGIYVKISVKIKELEMKHTALKDSFHVHERTNERTFEKIEKQLGNIDNKMDKILLSLTKE